MKKYILSLFFGGIIFVTIQAQIGIATENPLGIFHLDGLGDNNPSAIPSALQQQNDLVIVKDNADGISMGLGGIPQNTLNTQVEMKASDHAFLPNRVALTSTIDKVTVPNPIAGMVVYNISKTAGANQVQPGFYYFDGIKWYMLYSSDFVKGTISVRDLQIATTTTTANSVDYTNAAYLDFGGPIDIYESGSYAFSFRLYGRSTNNTLNFLRGLFYLWVLAWDSTSNSYLPIDVAELNTPLYPKVVDLLIPITYTVTMGGKLKAGDKVIFRISHGATTDSNYRWTLASNPGLGAAKTSLIYWKL